MVFQIEKRNIFSFRKLLIVILILLPLCYLSAVVYICHVDVPYEDQWDLIPLIKESFQGNVSMPDLMAQHNEHKIFFPKLIMLFLARLTDWRISYELLVNLVLGIGIFLILYFQARRTIGLLDTPKLVWAVPVVSLIVFSLNQWENWLWGFQMQIFMTVFCVVLGLILLSSPVFKCWEFIAAMIAGITAFYSFSNAIIFLFLGLAVLVVQPALKNRKERYIYIAGWVVYSGLLVISYFYNYRVPSNHSNILEFLQHPFAYLHFVIKYLGAPLTHLNRNAFVIGLLAVIFFCFLLWRLYKAGIEFKVLLPYLSLAMYSIASAALTGIGRFGSGSPMSPRYRSISNFFWVSIVFCIFLLLQKEKKRSLPGNKTNPLWKRYLLYVPLAIIVFYFARITITSTSYSVQRRDFLVSAKDSLLRDPDKEIAKRLYTPDGFVVIQRSAILKELKISVFRKNEE